MAIANLATRLSLGLALSATGLCAQGLDTLVTTAGTPAAGPAVPPDFSPFAEQFCIDCHNDDRDKGDFNMQALLRRDPVSAADEWDAVLWMLQEREMPPMDEPDVVRPEEAVYARVTKMLEPWQADVMARAAPSRTDTFVHAPAQLIDTYCLSCHNADDAKGELVLEALLTGKVEEHAALWEDVWHRMNARQMPPADHHKRPSEETYAAFTKALAGILDHHAQEHPAPGRTESIRRLNRTEYRNAIRDLLDLEVDVADLLPADEASHGFDNITVTNLSPTLLDRYLTAAQKVSRLAVGAPRSAPDGFTFRVPADRTQEQHVQGLPLGTRGGAIVPYVFPRDGVYEIRLRLMRDRNEYVEGLNGDETHAIDVLLNGERLQRFTFGRPTDGRRDHENVDAHLVYRGPIPAGPQQLGVTFPEGVSPVPETRRRPFEAAFNFHRHPRPNPALYQVSITGPFDSEQAGDSPSRRRIFTTTPAQAGGAEAAAREILAGLMRRAYRRPVGDADLAQPLAFFREEQARHGFEAGIEMALSAVLVSPQFLFRVERDPAVVEPGEVYAVSEFELASRLSFFLWSSLPDERLLGLAEAGRLRERAVLAGEVRRMLADPRSRNLATNFAGQWLYLRNLDSFTPNLRLFPDFDDNLRQAFRTETEMFVDSIVKEDRSALDLLTANYTYLNERLARHYGIPHVRGSRFRRVELPADAHRGGLLGQGSVLTVTSYATRTSPVLRGNWVLENLIGTPTPPPPPNVPSLDGVISEKLPIRERLELHRADPACATCHNLMDPVGFALENFDAVGRWRETEHGTPVDAAGGLPDGSTLHGVTGLREGLSQRPDLFVSTLTEKLLTFALGRGLTHDDAPAIRRIVRDAAAHDYRFSAIIQGIVESPPFQLRTAP